jgi:hypothetical protein
MCLHLWRTHSVYLLPLSVDGTCEHDGMAL